jgi:hypothetical protein
LCLYLPGHASVPWHLPHVRGHIDSPLKLKVPETTCGESTASPKHHTNGDGSEGPPNLLSYQMPRSSCVRYSTKCVSQSPYGLAWPQLQTRLYVTRQVPSCYKFTTLPTVCEIPCQATVRGFSKELSPRRHADEVAEWLRRWTANPLCSARVGSNPILVGGLFSTCHKSWHFGLTSHHQRPCR